MLLVMRLHLRHHHDDDEAAPLLPPGGSGWWDGVPKATVDSAQPVIHAALAAEMAEAERSGRAA